MLIEEWMPWYEFGGVHRIEVSAPPERALEAVKQVTPGEMPPVRLLFALRSLPALLLRKEGLSADRTVALYEQMAQRFVLLGEKPGLEIVVGGIGQMWKLVGGASPEFRDAEVFKKFREPGYAKVAASFSALSRDGRTELRTETRVLTTDSGSRRAFGRYWWIIRPWSGVIRRSWLRAAKRRAERGVFENGGLRTRLPNTAHTGVSLARSTRSPATSNSRTCGRCRRLVARTTFPRLVRLWASRDSSRSSSYIVRKLFAIRWKVGEVARLGQSSLRPRLGAADAPRPAAGGSARRTPFGPKRGPFTSLYVLDGEWALEIVNRTVHGVAHIGWVPRWERRLPRPDGRLGEDQTDCSGEVTWPRSSRSGA